MKMKTTYRKYLGIFMVCICLMGSLSIEVNAAVVRTDDEFFTIDYHPANTYDGLTVQISYKVSCTSSGQYYPSITDYHCTAYEDIFGRLHYFRIESCQIINKTDSGFTTRLTGYYEMYIPDTGLITTTDLLTYNIYRSY